MAFEWQSGVGQTSVTNQPNPGAVGELAYGKDQETKMESYVAINNDIPFGQMMAKVAGSDSQLDFPSTNTDQMVGVSVRDLQKVEGLYPKASQCAVLSFGQIWVSPEQAVTADDPVYIRYAGKKQVQTLVASANFVASNVIAGKVNGNSISVPFNTNNATTLSDLAAAIALIAGVNSAVSDGTHTVTITSDQDVTLALTVFAVTGGLSQPTFTITQTIAGIPQSARGSFRKDADSSTAVRIPMARYLTSTASFPNSSKRLAIVDIVWPQV